jgi:hypothetical protein
MRRLALALLPALLAAGGSLLVVPSSPSCKPTAPIEVEARIVGDPSAPFGVSARASSPSGAEVELEIVLPDEVTHLGGVKKLRARRCEARIDARVKDRRRCEIFVRATITEGGAAMTRVIPLVLFDAPLPPRGTLKRNSRGEAILEFSP